MRQLAIWRGADDVLDALVVARQRDPSAGKEILIGVNRPSWV